MSEMVIIKQR